MGGSVGGGVGGKGGPDLMPGSVDFTNISPSGSGSIFGGLSPFDLSVTEQAAGQNMEAIHNRYAQLGIAAPGGGPSTMEQQDIEGAQLGGDAAIGRIENFSLGPGPGDQINNAVTLANLANQQENQTQTQTALGQLAGLSGQSSPLAGVSGLGGQTQGGPGTFGDSSGSFG